MRETCGCFQNWCGSRAVGICRTSYFLCMSCLLFFLRLCSVIYTKNLIFVCVGEAECIVGSVLVPTIGIRVPTIGIRVRALFPIARGSPHKQLGIPNCWTLAQIPATFSLFPPHCHLQPLPQNKAPKLNLK